jgi:hypothetical protein
MKNRAGLLNMLYRIFKPLVHPVNLGIVNGSAGFFSRELKLSNTNKLGFK